MSLGSGTTRPALEDPEIYLLARDLELVGRGLADALVHGRHRGLLRGHGVEFHSHRSYEPGDDLRRLNWQLYARQRKLFTKESRRELQRPVHLLLDVTGSMAVAHGGWSKYAYAARVAAGLAQLACRQGDNPGLYLLGNGIESALPPRSGSMHLQAVWAELAASSPGTGADLPGAFVTARDLLKRRGFVIVISDFLDKEDLLLNEMAVMRQQGHEVLALQVLDPMEVSMPKTGDFDFIDPESGESVRVSAENHWRQYEANAAAWRGKLANRCAAQGIIWSSTTTAEPLLEMMAAWLETR
ncbi:MAG: hypothetical protein CFE26_03195 [Verrucomicrobiales bacterium VVV1]|nr:MAG: hypothetical protein CFE26_03195 [Verrucomicrobiales bacterium VVV1]